MTQLQRLAITPSQMQNDQILLTPPQQHYLGRVLRLQTGDRFIAMDGRGKWWLAKLSGEEAEILESLAVDTELPVAIALLIALPKGNGFDEVVRCCTELGVASITPLISDRTLLNPSSQKLERWRRIAQEAAEQSERAFVPTILEPMPFNQAVTSGTHRYICEARGSYPHLKTAIDPLASEVVIAIGPEGGWTSQEIAAAIAIGFQPVSLGGRILRAVTSPIVAMSVAAAIFEL